MFRALSVLLIKQLYYEIPLQNTSEINLYVMDPSILSDGKGRGCGILSISENISAFIHIIDKILIFLRY